MQYLHTMVRVSDLDESMNFYCGQLGMVRISRWDYEEGRFTLVMLAASGDEDRASSDHTPMLELTWNWDEKGYGGGRNFGHLAFRVNDIYRICRQLMDSGVTINRPPRDGRMAFVRSPDNISIELLQAGDALPEAEPWVSMPNIGEW
ncbi:MAG: VOC family protein [Gammaproteobacteria bacterium]|nr:VOC family protein [Gammaproteobacteria bacterium]